MEGAILVDHPGYVNRSREAFQRGVGRPERALSDRAGKGICRSRSREAETFDLCLCSVEVPRTAWLRLQNRGETSGLSAVWRWVHFLLLHTSGAEG